MSQAAENALIASKRRLFPWFADDEHLGRVSSPNSQINQCRRAIYFRRYFKMIRNFMSEFVKDEQGQDIVEYSLLLVLIGAAAVFVLTTMGTSISQIFSKINTKLTSANQSIS
ncbi:MAG: Flp family type IVb pilin [Acidobacteria bacterium]|nr:Flp family type IVb pilin [Acidobacteriota bacterium]